ncbi:gluconate 2-dehydrogenase subunit 3 family protein [Sphingomonas sp. UNC305MFCol5.2]|uniref:gluconate 2-dehydrogenase subunit 3 family protein n=1 Tax=Sphingomonas sp. UNC305MFCol5.2 TaxID=1449076 RepID=UPI000565C168
MIDRRDALAGIVAMFGASLFAPIARAAGAQMTPISDGPPSAPVFTAQQRALMTALSERVMPTTDTPGAITAGVPAFIEKLLADWAAPGDRKPILAGLDAIETRSQADYKVAADKATPAQQDALLTLAMEDKIPGGKDFFEKFRQLVITGYFTSEVGITQEREYLPVPGRYDGAYPYSKVNKVFSS